MTDRGGYLESVEEIPEPHAFTAHVHLGEDDYPVVFEEHEHALGSAQRDNNMRAAVVHVMADAAVSLLVIVGLLLARAFGWLWMDPLAGIIGAMRHRELVVWPDPGYRGHPTRYEPRSAHGGQSAASG